MRDGEKRGGAAGVGLVSVWEEGEGGAPSDRRGRSEATPPTTTSSLEDLSEIAFVWPTCLEKAEVHASSGQDGEAGQEGQLIITVWKDVEGRRWRDGSTA